MILPAVTSSEPFDRSGPVPAAVRAAGYVSEEEESEEEDGSSVEEETDEETDEEEEPHRAHAHGTQTQAQPAAVAVAVTAAAPEAPGYSAPAQGSGIEVGSNGYAIEKKGFGPAGDAEGSGDLTRRLSRKEEVRPRSLFSSSFSTDEM